MTTIKCPNARRFRANRRRRAQTTVEFSLICLPFFAILFGLIDWAQIYFYENSMQNGLREACRFATAGRIIQATSNGTPLTETNVGGVAVPKAINDSAGREASRNECIRYWFQSNCVIYMPLSNITIVSAPTLPGSPAPITTNSYGRLVLDGLITNASTGTVTTNNIGPGAANDYIQITITNTITTITPLFGYLGGYDRGGWNSYSVHVSAIVKNEPALLNFQHTDRYSDEPYDSSWAP